MKNFRTYNLAVEFYRLCTALQIDRHLKEQLLRAASSIALNLAEGCGRAGNRDRARFFQIAFGSLRESQAIIELSLCNISEPKTKADLLAAHIYRLIQSCRG